MKNNIIFLATRLSAIAFLIAAFVSLGGILFSITEGSPLHEIVIFITFTFMVIVEGVLLVALFFLAQDIAMKNYKPFKPTKL